MISFLVACFNEEKNIINTIIEIENSCEELKIDDFEIIIIDDCSKDKSKELVNKFEYFFGEDQGRYIIEIESSNVNKVNDLLKKNSVHFDDLGIIEENNLSFNGELNLPIEDLTKTHKYWLKGYMEN